MCYRYDFDLPAEAREANLTFHVPIKAKYRVSVNGTAEPFLEKHRVDTRTIDLMPYLKQGHNVLCVTLEGQLRNFQTGVQLVAEGMVYGQDGSIIKLATDKTWTCACDPDKGWDKPGPCPDYMKPVDAGRHPGKYYTLYLPIVPPYHGPIRIQPADMSQPIFDQEKPVELAVTVLNAAKSVVSDQKPGIN